MYHISLIISHTSLYERSHAKNVVRLTIEMRLTFVIFVESTVRYAIAYIVYTKSNIHVSPHLVEGNFWKEMMALRIEGATYNRVRLIIGEIQYTVQPGLNWSTVAGNSNLFPATATWHSFGSFCFREVIVSMTDRMLRTWRKVLPLLGWFCILYDQGHPKYVTRIVISFPVTLR